MPYEADALCDVCDKRGAYDFMGDYFCRACTDKYVDLCRPPEDTLPRGEIWYECIEDDIIQWEEGDDEFSSNGRIVAEVGNPDAVNWLLYYANLGLKYEHAGDHDGEG